MNRMLEPKKFSWRQKVHPDVTARDTNPAPVPPDTPGTLQGNGFTIHIKYCI